MRNHNQAHIVIPVIDKFFGTFAHIIRRQGKDIDHFAINFEP